MTIKGYEKVPLWAPRRSGHLWNEELNMPISEGRPSLYNSERAKLVIDALKKGLAISEAAKCGGVALQTLYNWRRENEIFNQAMAEALAPGGKPRRTKTIKRPRRDDFDNLVANIILDELATGRTITDICKAIDMPARQTVMRWAKIRPDFKARIDACRKKKTPS